MNCSNQKGTIQLDVADSGQVSSPRSINLTLGNPPAHLVILTGIAMPGWDSQSDLDGAEVIINLRTAATLVLGWTASIGLASIGNDDSEFTFATDEVELELINGNLELHACIAVQGEPSSLNRFSYEVTVVLQIDEPLIAGTIRWDDGTIDGGPAAGTPWFRLEATTHIDDGTPFGRTDSVVKADTGLVQPTPVGARTELPYVLRGVPFNLPVTVAVIPNGLAAFPGHLLQVEQTSGPAQPITLTGAAPQVLDLDFVVNALEVPK